MFVSKSSLFVAVTLLALSAIAEADRVCKKYHKGNTDPPAFAVSLVDILLPPGLDKLTLTLNGCPSGTGHVGTKLEACDEGIAPIVKFYGVNYVVIFRPNPVGTGVIRGKIYCLAGAVSSTPEPSPFASLGAGNLPHFEASVQH